MCDNSSKKEQCIDLEVQSGSNDMEVLPGSLADDRKTDCGSELSQVKKEMHKKKLKKYRRRLRQKKGMIGSNVTLLLVQIVHLLEESTRIDGRQVTQIYQ